MVPECEIRSLHKVGLHIGVEPGQSRSLQHYTSLVYLLRMGAAMLTSTSATVYRGDTSPGLCLGLCSLKLSSSLYHERNWETLPLCISS